MAKQKTENEEYKRLLEKHEALDDLTAEALDTRRVWFIQEVIDHYDMVEIGTLYFGDMAIDVESIYYDKTEHRLIAHISSKEMEGDITYTSLEREKARQTGGTGIRGNEVPRRRTDVAGHDD